MIFCKFKFTTNKNETEIGKVFFIKIFCKAYVFVKFVFYNLFVDVINNSEIWLKKFVTYFFF